jgi:hypothetical protein
MSFEDGGESVAEEVDWAVRELRKLFEWGTPRVLRDHLSRFPGIAGCCSARCFCAQAVALFRYTASHR